MNWLRKFMMGRYGLDQLSIALLAFSFVLSFVIRPIELPFLWLIVYIPLGFYLYRILSRDILRRQRENYIFLQYWQPVYTFLFRYFRKIRDIRQYRYYRCPNCKGELRVPQGKGKIKITCPRCHQEFIKKT